MCVIPLVSGSTITHSGARRNGRSGAIVSMRAIGFLRVLAASRASDVQYGPVLSSRSRRESLFTPRRRPRQGDPRRFGRWALLAVLALGVYLVARRPAAFLTALWEGRRAIARGEHLRAQEKIERAWALRPGHRWVHDTAGLLFIERGGPEWRARARESYARAIAAGMRSNPFINHEREARRLLDRGRYDQAEVEIEHAMALAPRSAGAGLLLGHLHFARGRLAPALEAWQSALTLAPNSDEIQAAITRAQETRSRGTVSYLLDHEGQVLAARDIASGGPVYPFDALTAHVVGFRSADHGTGGLEGALGGMLEGNTAVLTLDVHLQRIADTALGGRKGAVVVLDPATGDVLAAVSHPKFSAAQIDRAWGRIRNNENIPLRNRAMDSTYEPGSIAKLITTAALLESGADTSRIFPFRCRGYLMQGAETFYDWTAHRTVDTFGEAFNESCNIAMARIAPMIGPATLSQFLRSFGFGEQDRIPLELPVASSRAPLDPEGAPALAAAAVGVGPGFRITPLHAAMVAAAIANGGVMMAPRLVREVRSVTGQLLSETEPRVYKISMKRATATALTERMVDFVQNGIGRKARVHRVAVAGKTGTAGSSKKGLHGWFVCFAPAEKPRFAIAILCENGGPGHAVAAPIAQRLLSEALR